MAGTRKQSKKITETLQQPDEIRAAIDYGIDIEMLIDNLKRSPAERIRRHQIALNAANILRKTARTRMNADSSNMFKRLAEAGVDFVIVDGFAGVVYGAPLPTQTIDICCDFSTANLLALQKAVSDLHPIHRMTPKRQKFELTEETCGQFKNLYLDTDIGQLDCLSFIDGLGDYQKVKQASEVIEVENLQLRVLSVDALIETKKAMNRPRDKEAVLQLEAIKKLRNR